MSICRQAKERIGTHAIRCVGCFGAPPHVSAGLWAPGFCPFHGVTNAQDAQLAKVILTEGISTIRFDAADDATAAGFREVGLMAMKVTDARTHPLPRPICIAVNRFGGWVQQIQ